MSQNFQQMISCPLVLASMKNPAKCRNFCSQNSVGWPELIETGARGGDVNDFSQPRRAVANCQSTSNFPLWQFLLNSLGYPYRLGFLVLNIPSLYAGSDEKKGLNRFWGFHCMCSTVHLYAYSVGPPLDHRLCQRPLLETPSQSNP